jgi:hypothetical protein
MDDREETPALGDGHTTLQEACLLGQLAPGAGDHPVNDNHGFDLQE